LKYLCKKKPFEIELVLTRPEIDYNEIYSLGIKIHIIERRNLKKDPRLFISFYKISRIYKPDLIHVWGNMAAFYAIPAKILLKIPMINSQITDAFSIVSKGLLSHKTTFLFSNLIVSNSKAGLLAYSSPPAKSRVIYNGFNFDRVKNLSSKKDIRDKLNINTKYVVGMAASFSELKDYTSFIEAANILLSKNKNITFLCLGKGDDSEYRKLVMSEWIDNVKFLGLQSNVESIMNCCDIGVLSTYTEGLPNSIMEFMALGKPVVVTRGGGTEELVLDNETGCLVKAKSPIEIAEKINYLLENQEIADIMGVKGRERIQSNFTLKSMANQFIKVYEEFALN
jgi:glycosyltransferase involved in cell wall biosynthesis